MKTKMTKKQQKRMVQGLVALLSARALIMKGKKVLETLTDEDDLLKSLVVMSYAIPVSALLTHVFGEGELRDEAFKVLAGLVKEAN